MSRWRVMKWGIKDTEIFNYEIDGASLWETEHNEGEIWRWPIHISQKKYVSNKDLIDFVEAMRKYHELHSKDFSDQQLFDDL